MYVLQFVCYFIRLLFGCSQPQPQPQLHLLFLDIFAYFILIYFVFFLRYCFTRFVCFACLPGWKFFVSLSEFLATIIQRNFLLRVALVSGLTVCSLAWPSVVWVSTFKALFKQRCSTLVYPCSSQLQLPPIFESSINPSSSRCESSSQPNWQPCCKFTNRMVIELRCLPLCLPANYSRELLAYANNSNWKCGLNVRLAKVTKILILCINLACKLSCQNVQKYAVCEHSFT